jgi:hypothetical protein
MTQATGPVDPSRLMGDGWQVDVLGERENRSTREYSPFTKSDSAILRTELGSAASTVPRGLGDKGA